ncbi:DUF4405 domain-containing protein [Marinomonas pollencensis]|uniref:Uncharacterized protein DUF4405 n=1 Tax=Marinomonas pollencensis TaxID=491954 RepID=A0A3E0DLC8_9GAMM|nr:DUF4405 domain-containing protein [Marinomonas pollencensis]REG82901.1 uncharacterized protein DUF4405 [Marinomonas pollencensis]
MSDWKQNLQKTRYVMDVLLIISFMLISAPQSTGIPLHEWGSLLFIVPFMIHLLLHWEWIKKSAKRFVRKMTFKERFSSALNYLLYMMMLLIFVSGFLVSVSLLPTLHITIPVQDFWSKIHNEFASFIMPVIGIHLALHWRWIVNMVKKMSMKGARA